MTHEFILSGFGGQGIMLIGQLLIQAGLEEGRHVSWIPSYGPEMRGGTAYCSVIVSDELIGCPVVGEPSLVLAMNLPSKERFENQVRPSGYMIVNSSLVSEKVTRTDIKGFSVPLNELAQQAGHDRMLNTVALGAICAAVNPVKKESVSKAMVKLFGKKAVENPKLIEMNMKAFELGRDTLCKMLAT